MYAERRLVNFQPAVYKVGKKHGVEIGIGKMNRRKNTFRKATVAGILLCFLSTLFTGCKLSKKDAKEQKKWVEQMNEIYPDDHFEYVKPYHYNTSIFEEKNEAIVRSENYPNEEISVRGPSNELSSNYNCIRYEKETEEYVYDYFSDKFVCDDYEISYQIHDTFSPVENMSAEEYFQNYVDLNRIEIIIYRKDGIFPDKETMKEKLIDICKDRDEIFSFYVYCCKSKTSFSNADNTCECYYSLDMYEKRKINSLRYNDSSISEPLLVGGYAW